MNKGQFWILNIVGGVCAALIIGNLVLINLNEKSSRSLMSVQENFNQAQQVRTTMENLAVRVAQAGLTDVALSNLLVRHELRVTLNNPAGVAPAPSGGVPLAPTNPAP